MGNYSGETTRPESGLVFLHQASRYGPATGVALRGQNEEAAVSTPWH